ncbi:hypothetical protein [Chryseobacterium arthrosphaerae]|uniref:hypothetical protein n=1 Tax=Chryseobacterium arthrosphaerae TaxID=651561 RepID=UPI003D34542A
MKKILQTVYSYKNIEVTDADTGKKEIAQYQMILGIPFRIRYKPIFFFDAQI